MKKRSVKFLNTFIMLNIFLLFVCGLSTQPVFAKTYNSVTDFTTVNNPSGPWSYEYVSIGDPNSASSLMTSCCLNNGWNYPSDMYTNVGGDFMHPGNDLDAILAFSASDPGIVSLHIDVSDGDSNAGSDGQILSIWKNDMQIGGYYDMGATFEEYSINETININTSDKIYVRLNKKDNNGWDTINTNVTATVVPEPLSSALFLTGGATLVIRRFRTKKI